MMNPNGHIDKVKARIRKLLAIAADDSTIDGEITAAMALAERAMEAYHLDRADLEVEATKTTEEAYGKHAGACIGARMTTWECSLFNAVAVLVGSVEAYKTTIDRPKGVFQVASKKSAVMWYGPAEDARLAAELYEEWALSIAAIAIGKYGGAARGEGARYCFGFATALLDNARSQARKRREISTESTRALVLRGQGTLADLLIRKRSKAKNWLQKTEGWRPRKSSGARVGYTATAAGRDAYQAGKSDGASASFSAKRTPKLGAR